MPFVITSMADQNELYLLKVLSGSHQGAEIALKPGEYLVGSSADCDIILSDQNLASEHFKLTVGDDGVHIVSMGEPLYLGGKAAEEDPLPVQNFEFITAGTTHLVVGPVDGDWPVLSPEDAPPLEKESEVASDGSEKGEGAEGEAAAAQLPPKGFMASMLAKIAGPIKAYLEHPIYLTYKYFIWGGLVALFLVLFAITFTFTYSPHDPKPDLGAIELRVIGDLNSVPFDHDLGVRIVEDHVYVYGYVDTTRQKRVIQALLEPYGPRVSQRIQSEEAMLQSTRDILNQFNLTLYISIDAPGRIKVEGYVMDIQKWKRAQTLISQDVAGLETLDVDLFTAKDIMAKANDILEEAKLLRSVKILPQAKVIIAQGNIPPEQAADWRKAKRLLIAYLHNRVPLQDRVVLSSSINPEALYFDNQIKSINSEEPGWITLANGEHYFEGATLPTGYEIVSISTDGIRLKRGATEVFVRFKNL